MSISLRWLFMGFFTLVGGTEIRDARAIVTGGANGIGYACAYDLLREGARMVSIMDIDVVNGTMATQTLIDEFGEGRVVFYRTDVSDSVRFELDFTIAVQSMGGLDIIINSAGLAIDTIWQAEIATNINGVVQGTLMSLDVMGKHKGGNGGTVVNLGSIGSFIALKILPVYIATKHAVLGFSRSVAESYDVTGVSIQTMCPGNTVTFEITSQAHRFFDFIDYDAALKHFEEVPLQTTDVVSKEVVRMIKTAPNGAIWVVEGDGPTMSIDIPNYKDLGTPV